MSITLEEKNLAVQPPQTVGTQTAQTLFVREVGVGNALVLTAVEQPVLNSRPYQFSHWTDSSVPSFSSSNPQLTITPVGMATISAVYRDRNVPTVYATDIGWITLTREQAAGMPNIQLKLFANGSQITNVNWSLSAGNNQPQGQLTSAGGIATYSPPQGQQFPAALTQFMINAATGGSVVATVPVTLWTGNRYDPILHYSQPTQSGSSAVFTFTAQDRNGATDLEFVQFLMRQAGFALPSVDAPPGPGGPCPYPITSPDWALCNQVYVDPYDITQNRQPGLGDATAGSGCRVLLDIPFRTLWLQRDSASFVSDVLGAPGVLSNGRCNVSPSSVGLEFPSNDSARIVLPLGFVTESFNGPMSVIYRVHDAASLPPTSLFAQWHTSGGFAIQAPIRIVAPEGLSLVRINPGVTSAAFEWHTSPGRRTDTQIEYWRLTPPGQLSRTGYVTPSGSDPVIHSTTLSDLLPGTTYNYRVRSTEEGTGETASFAGTFSTEGGIPSFTSRQINLGGPAEGDWEASIGCNGGSASGAARPFDAPSVYKTQLYGMTNCQYAVPDNRAYLVTLKFAEIFYANGGPQGLAQRRRFHVSLNGAQVLTNFSAAADAGSVDRAVDKTFVVMAQNEMIDVRFTAVNDNPILNGIQITPATPAAFKRVNLGGGHFTGPDGKVWEADPAGTGSGTTGTAASIANADYPTLYQTQRYGPSGSMNLSYSGFPSGAYDVTLKFAEIFYGSVGAAGGRHLNVDINGLPALRNFNPASAAGAVNRAVDRTFQVFVESGSINLQLSSTADAPILNAIEIAPSRFWARRVNAGSTLRHLDLATGKLWAADESFTGGTSHVPVPPPSVPEIYRTNRYYTQSAGYRFPVPSGSYSVRLSFAEIFCPAPNRRFDVRIKGITVLGNFNPFSIAGCNGIVQRAFLVPVDDSKVIDIEFASLTGDPPIVSAIEIESVDAASYPTMSLSISPGSVTAPQAATGVVALGTAVAGGAVVQLVSGNPTLVSVPSSVAIPAGQTSASFPIATTSPSTSQTVAVTANYEGVLSTYPLTVNPATSTPTIFVSPASLAFSATQGGANPASQTFTISNVGGGTLSWNATNLPAWLSLNPSSGTAPSTVTAAVSIAGLAAGTYSASVNIGATGASNTPQVLPVSLTVNAAGSNTVFLEDFESAAPVVAGEYEFVQAQSGVQNELYPAGKYSFDTDPNQLHNLYCTVADHTPSPGNRMMVVNGKGFAVGQTFTRVWERTLTNLVPQTNYRFSAWVAAAYPDSPAQIQLRVANANSGTPVTAPNSCGGASPWVQVSTTFTASSATALLQIVNTNGSGDGNDFALDDIQLSVETPAATIGASPTSLTFNATQGGANPAQQTVTLTNSANLAWTATTTQTWLAVTPQSGSSGATLTVSATTGSLAAGTHNAILRITAAGAGNSPLDIPVTFTVGSASSPTISRSPASLSYSATAGGSNPANQTFTISNTGGGTLNWTASSNQSWLSLSPASGAGPATVTASVNIVGLSANTYNATVTIAATGATNTPQTIPVTLTVNPSGGAGPILVGHWKFDEASGATALDSSGTSPASNGAIVGTTFARVPGKFGSALSLGASSVVDLGNPAALRVFTAPPSVSVSAWVKSTSASAGWRSVVAWDSGSGDYYKIDFNRASGVVFYVRTQQAPNIREVIYNASLADDNWHLLTGTYSGATGALSLYVDGVLRQSAALGAGLILEPGGSGDHKVYIGGQQNNQTPRAWEYLNATVDDVRIYNGALSATDVSALFNASGGPPSAPSGLVATRGNGQITLSWNASSGATSYNVKRATASGGPYTTVASGVTATTHPDTGLTNGAVYYYVVSSVNGSGESANSSEVSNAPFAPFKDDLEPTTFAFTSQYTYAAPAGNTTLHSTGRFSVATNPNSLHGSFCTFGDHTTGTGKMMVVNANAPARSVWTKTIPGLAAGQTYTLSLWVASAYHQNPSELQFRVNGANLTPPKTAPTYGTPCPATTNGAWQQHVVTFQAPATSVTVDILSLRTDDNGNDFALDDIELK